MSGPLSGFRILDLSRVLSGPVATVLLADQGADVIKVEPLAGDISRHMGGNKGGVTPGFLSANRGKRSIALDLKSDAGIDVVKRLAALADVFVQNFRPGAPKVWGSDLTSSGQSIIGLILSSTGISTIQVFVLSDSSVTRRTTQTVWPTSQQ